MSVRYKNIARVVRTHGIHGEVVAVPLRGLSPLLREGLRVCLTPPALDRERWSTVEAVAEMRDGEQLVALSCAHDLSAAEGLVGTTVLAAEADLDLDVLEMGEDEILGREVEDVRFGLLGTVEEVLYSPAHDVWVCRGERGETMIPVVEEFVVDVPSAGAVVVSVPDGLLDL